MTNEPEARGSRHTGRDDAITIRLGAVALPLGIILLVAATAVHPSREDVMDNPAVFMEYARSDGWVAVHFAQWFAALLVFGGLVAVYYAISTTSDVGAGLARFGFAAAVLAVSAITVLQAVDGVALKWAVDSWASAPPDREAASFAAAEALRWTEYSLQSFSNVLLGLSLGLYGLAIALGSIFPRWLGWVAIGAGVAWIIHGLMVPYLGFFDSLPRGVALILTSLWAFGMGFLMWRGRGRHPLAEREEASRA